MIDVKLEGLEQVRAALQTFSDRRFSAVVSTALTKTAKELARGWQQQISTKIDRPSPRTQSATGFVGASAANLRARVYVKDQLSGLAPAAYLAPLETGGGRTTKKFERALISAGAMPAGYVTVPGRAATRDGYGNVSRGLIVAVIAQLGADYSPGYQRVISKKTAKRLATRLRRGLNYVSVLPEQARQMGVSPGIYEQVDGKALKAMFLFRSAVSYRRQLNLLDTDEASVAIQRTMQDELDSAIDKSAKRMRENGK